MSWTDTKSQLSDVEVDSYHIYRNLIPPDLNGWELIAVVDSASTSYWDESFDGSTDAAYLVIHATKYPFGHESEGLFGNPALIRSVATT